MINKIYKRIHNKYSILFKFLFFLRYLFVIFFISVVMFFTIPHFFDYKKKDAVIKEFLLDNYNLKLQEYENIKYNALPIPNIEIKNIKAGVETDTIKIDALSLKIYPKLLNIYNYVDFKTNKIVLNKSRILLSDNNLKALIAYIYNSKNRLIILNSNLQVKKSDSLLINIKNLHFSNHRYNKNIFTGELFKKKFKIIISDNFNKINFKLFKTGVKAEVNLNEIKNEYLKNGVFKSKFLNSNLKFNFKYDDKKIKIYNSFFRNKDLSFNNETIVIYKPFFSFNSIFKIEDIDINLFKDLNLNQILAQKEFIKNLNTRNKIDFKSKKFDKNLIDNLNLKINLSYGRLTYTKDIEISDSLFKCYGNINLLTEYPILYFDCKITSKDKKKFLKGFSIKNKNKNEIFNIKVEGNVNILNNKINFKNITANQDYEASKEDLNYFKTSFERIFFNKNLFGIFDIKKIREFIIEIS